MVKADDALKVHVDTAPSAGMRTDSVSHRTAQSKVQTPSLALKEAELPGSGNKFAGTGLPQSAGRQDMTHLNPLPHQRAGDEPVPVALAKVGFTTHNSHAAAFGPVLQAL
jgi:hypothetical protein